LCLLSSSRGQIEELKAIFVYEQSSRGQIEELNPIFVYEQGHEAKPAVSYPQNLSFLPRSLNIFLSSRLESSLEFQYNLKDTSFKK